jgi:hypothetical protein
MRCVKRLGRKAVQFRWCLSLLFLKALFKFRSLLVRVLLVGIKTIAFNLPEGENRK